MVSYSDLMEEVSILDSGVERLYLRQLAWKQGLLTGSVETGGFLLSRCASDLSHADEVWSPLC